MDSRSRSIQFRDPQRFPVVASTYSNGKSKTVMQTKIVNKINKIILIKKDLINTKYKLDGLYNPCVLFTLFNSYMSVPTRSLVSGTIMEPGFGSDSDYCSDSGGITGSASLDLGFT